MTKLYLFCLEFSMHSSKTIYKTNIVIMIPKHANHPVNPAALFTALPVICSGTEVFELPDPVGDATGTLVGLKMTT